MKRSNKFYGVGLLMFLFGGAGLAENITSGRGSELVCIVFSVIGLGLILMSYVIIDDKQSKKGRRR